jgi:outer membrane murein-binding lipoprotein Lpp
MESGHPVVRTRGPFDGKFTFTAHEAGDHSICLAPASVSAQNTHIKLYIDIVVGSTRPNIDQDRSHVSNLASKIRDLNAKLDDIKREQQYQREREASYRDLSESTNTRAVWYSVLQIGVLVATCTWQLRHLRVRSFLTSACDLRLQVLASIRISSTIEKHVKYLNVLYPVLLLLSCCRLQQVVRSDFDAHACSNFNKSFLPTMPNLLVVFSISDLNSDVASSSLIDLGICKMLCNGSFS